MGALVLFVRIFGGTDLCIFFNTCQLGSFCNTKHIPTRTQAIANGMLKTHDIFIKVYYLKYTEVPLEKQS